MGLKIRGLRQRQEYLPSAIDSVTAVDQTVSSTMWSMISNASTGGIKFIGTIFFARLLSPADFGVITITLVFISFVMLFVNVGIANSIIYFKDLTKKDLSTAWWSNVILDGGAGLVCVIGAPFAARYFNEPRAQYLVYVFAIDTLIGSLGSIHGALMKKQYMFKEAAILGIAVTALSTIGAVILIKYYAYGIWGLMISMLACDTLGLVAMFLILPWFPSFLFSMEALKRQVGFGKWLLGMNLVSYANQSLDQFTTGKFLDMRQLGFYSFANNVPNLIITRYIYSLNSVSFVTLSHIKSDIKAAGDFFTDLIQSISLLTFPMFVGLSLISNEFVRVVYGNQWLEVIPVMKIICLGAIVRALAAVLPTVLISLGAPQLAFRSNAIMLPLSFAGMYFFAKYYGIIGVAVVMILGAALIVVLNGAPAMRMLQLRLVDLIKPAMPALLCSGIMYGFLSPLEYYGRQKTPLPPLVLLIGCIVVGGLVYIVALRTCYASLFFRYYNLIKRKCLRAMEIIGVRR